MQYKSNKKIILDKRKLDTVIRLGCPSDVLLCLITTGKYKPTGDSLIDENLESMRDEKEFTNWGGNRNPTGKNQYTNKNNALGQVDHHLDHQDEAQDIGQLEDIDKDKDKDKYKYKIKNNRYGECKNVLLTEEQYNKLSSEHKNLNQAIEKLDTWLGTSGGKNKNKNHFAYFKSNSWVWENLKPDAFELYTMLTKKSKIPDEVYIDIGSFYLDNTFDEFKDMTDDECNNCAKWLLDKFRCQTLPRDRFVKIVRGFKNGN